jgi:hypothetical protein
MFGYTSLLPWYPKQVPRFSSALLFSFAIFNPWLEFYANIARIQNRTMKPG